MKGLLENCPRLSREQLLSAPTAHPLIYPIGLITYAKIALLPSIVQYELGTLICNRRGVIQIVTPQKNLARGVKSK
eukprot:13397992-Ditylum_brightwellii.AAC.1